MYSEGITVMVSASLFRLHHDSIMTYASLAALTMYQRARKLHDLTVDRSLILSLGEAQLEAYLLSMNCLSLLDPKSAWIVMPVLVQSGREVG
jgi:hypothetical protein